MKKYTLCTVLSCVLTIPAYNALALTGLDCTAQPSCEDLGYSTSTSCNNGSLIYCPFNLLYKKCIPNAPSSDTTTDSECSYIYDTAHYPNVRETSNNESCVRDGVTYYKEICSGIREADCEGNFTKTCTAYNGAPYGTCEECSYMYDIEHYPNVRTTSENESCVRDGVTYYKEICSGIKETDCEGNFTKTCSSYNGVPYGTCEETCSYLYDIGHYSNVREISNNESCVRDGVTYYKEICSGTREADCEGNFTKTCTAYNGALYGTCEECPAKGCGYEFSLKVNYSCGPSCGLSNCYNLYGATSAYEIINVIFYDSTGTTQISSATFRLSFYSLYGTSPSGSQIIEFDKNIPAGTYKVYVSVSSSGSPADPIFRSISISGNTVLDTLSGINKFNGEYVTVTVPSSAPTPKTMNIDMSYCGGVWSS